jgi:hypothetical protein
MFEQYREMENSLHEVSNWIGRIVRLLSGFGSPAPETYLAATRAIRGLQEAWILHLDIERILFPRMLCRNLLSAESLGRITASNQAIETQLDAILSASWPRSPQAGMQSVRTGAARIVCPLLAQIESERALILPAILRMDRREPTVIHAETETSELMTT